MITIAIEVSGIEVQLRKIVQSVSGRMYLPTWESYSEGRGNVEIKLGTWDGDSCEEALAALDSFVSDCTKYGVAFHTTDVSADLRITLAVDSAAGDPVLSFWPSSLAELSRLGIGLNITAAVGIGYAELADDDEDADDEATADRSADIANVVELLTSVTRSVVGRTASSTFALIKETAPAIPFSLSHRREISSLLAHRYAPPFYASDGAAKSAASQHAKAVWALSNTLGDANATNIAAFLASL